MYFCFGWLGCPLIKDLSCRIWQNFYAALSKCLPRALRGVMQQPGCGQSNNEPCLWLKQQWVSVKVIFTLTFSLGTLSCCLAAERNARLLLGKKETKGKKRIAWRRRRRGDKVSLSLPRRGWRRAKSPISVGNKQRMKGTRREERGVSLMK